MSKLVFKCMFAACCLCMLCVLPVMAADGDSSANGSFVIDLSSFTGIVAVVSFIVTEVFKAIPAIKDTKLAKIGISVLTGAVLCYVAWVLKLSPAMTVVTSWWGALLYGIAAGLSGCGFYDVIKAVAVLFKKGDPDD